ncbi:MAG: isoprenylcysteine carboxylmethyltransferase family protein [Myxococcota bacterium]
MQQLEHRVPPPLVALACLALGVILRWAFPSLSFTLPGHYVWVAMFVGAGFALGRAAFQSFARAETTFSPVRPDRTSTLVTTGVYAWTRNPMYVSLALVLFGLLLALGNLASLLAVVALVAYLDRFQIQPEERILRGLLGDEYEEYLRAVRRWI